MTPPPRSAALRLVFVVVAALAPTPAPGQSRAAVEQERASFAEWVSAAPLSPRRAVVVRPIGPGLSVGPADTDIPLAGWRLMASGPAGRAAVTVFSADVRPGKSPGWFPYDAGQVFPVMLSSAKAVASVRVLGTDGVEVEATEAGTVTVTLAGAARRLRVLRMPGGTDEEAELEIYFQDRSNGKGTYPSGRFVALLPAPGGGHLLDLNRARNPFCAYNTVFPCPAPWRGNAIPVAIRAGERYDDSGTGPPTPN